MRNISYYLAFILLFMGYACKPSEDLHTMHFDDSEDLKDFFDTRKNHSKLISAHRGGSYAFYPENCINTFEHVLEYTPALFEVDVEMSMDSVLVLMHDATLDRTTTGMGSVRDKMWWELRTLKLKDKNGIVTPYKIPRLKKALKWARKNTILTVDAKDGVPLEMVLEAIDKKNAEAAVIIFVNSTEEARLVYAYNSDLLISMDLMNSDSLDFMIATGIPAQNIVAFTGEEPQSAYYYQQLHEKGIPVISSTVSTLDPMTELPEQMEYYKALWRLGINIISTDIPIELGTYLLKHPELMQERPIAIPNP